MFLDKTKQLNFDSMQKVSSALLNSTDKTMELIEKYCEFDKK